MDKLRAILWASLLLVSGQVNASSIFHWTGTCSLGCTGNSTGVLTLGDGASPLDFTRTQFISWEYVFLTGETYTLGNTSPYLIAEGHDDPAWLGVLLEENALGPQTLPLFQFGARAPSVENGIGRWQFIVNEDFFYHCLNPDCSLNTAEVYHVGVGSFFEVANPVPIPAAAWLFGSALLGFFGLSRRKLAT